MKSILNQEEILRYSRHLLIPQVGLSGQEKLKKASVLIVGTGGLGSPISLYLTAAGIGRIGLVDYDVVDESNLQRQVIHTTSRIGDPKVNSAKKYLKDLNPHVEIEIFNEMLLSSNIEEIAKNYQIIIDGSDNFATRYLLNDYCVFTKKTYIYGSIFRFEGQVSVFDAQYGPCYRCIFPTPPPPGIVPSCGEGGVFGVLPGTIGTIQASEVIKLILGLGDHPYGKLHLYDAIDLSIQTIQLKKNPKCKICGNQPEITTLEDTTFFCELHSAEEEFNPEWEWTVHQLRQTIEDKNKFQLIDVRDPIEREVVIIPQSENIPYEKINVEGFQNNETPIIFYCRNGVRSGRTVKKLRSAGFNNVFNLSGGTNAWVREIDPVSYQY
ncbi:MAG TPA: molybdopterin-synthase adenylyltransferase MoeB [Anaerolineaceae bacterium]|nr:molybdopterin-synthase adenylyltransferase MoeB [Anaerolineaceae bacterium]